MPERRRMERVTIIGDIPVGVSYVMREAGLDSKADNEYLTKIEADDFARPYECIIRNQITQCS